MDAAEERKAVALDLSKKTSFHARLEVAKALDDRDELKNSWKKRTQWKDKSRIGFE